MQRCLSFFKTPKALLVLTVVLALGAGGAFLFLEHGAHAAGPYYVRTDGSDTTCNGLDDQPATAGNPCAFASPQIGANALGDGETLLIRGGRYTTQGTMISTASTIIGLQNQARTIESQRITIKALSGTGEVIFDGQLGTQAGIVLNNVNYVTIEGISFENFTNDAGGFGTQPGVLIIWGSSHDIIVRGVKIRGTKPHKADNLATSGSNTLYPNICANCAEISLGVGTVNNITVENSEIDVRQPYGISSRPDTNTLINHPGVPQFIIIRNNRVTHLLDDHRFYGIFGRRANQVTVDGNYIADIASVRMINSTNGSMGIVLRDDHTWTIRNNVIETMSGGIYLWDDLNSTDGETLNEAHLVYNNTIIGTPDDAQEDIGILMTGVQDSEVWNNIIQNTRFGFRLDNGTNPAGLTTYIGSNLFYNIFGTPQSGTLRPDYLESYSAAARTISINTASDQHGNPNFTGSGGIPDPFYRLTSASTLAIDKGDPARACGSPAVDGDSNSSVICDIGAYEFSGAVPGVYHVSANGSDTGCNGTFSDPYPGSGTGLNCAFKTIQKGVDMTVAGNTVLVHNGTYGGWQPTCNPTVSTGCKYSSIGKFVHLVGVKNKSNIVIKAAPGENPVLDGRAVAGQPLDTAFYVIDSPFVTVDGFTMTNFNASSTISGQAVALDFQGTIIWNRNSTDGRIVNNTITNSQPDGLNYIAQDIILEEGPLRTKVIGNYIEDTNTRVAIAAHKTSSPPTLNSGIEISNNYIKQNKDGSIVYTQGLRGIAVLRVNGVQILNNFLWSADASKRADSAVMYIRDESDIAIKGNVATGYAIGLEIQDSNSAGGSNDEERHVIANNTFVGNGKANPEAGFRIRTGDTPSCDGCLIKGNVILSFYNGIFIDQDPTDPWTSYATIGNNVVYDATRATIGSSFTSGDTVVENNNVFNISSPASDVIVDAASLIPSSSTWLQRIIGAATPSSPYYELKTASPAIDVGDNIVCPWSPIDGDGVGGATCDAGAYEYTGGGPPINNPPSVDAGADQGSPPNPAITTGQTVNLSGAASDIDGTVNALAWSVVLNSNPSQPAVDCALTPGAASPALPAADTTLAATLVCTAPNTYRAVLTATDDDGTTNDTASAASFAVIVITAPGTQVVLQGTSDADDTRLYQFAPTTNYGTLDRMQVGPFTAGTQNNRGLVRFDLSGIPTGATITQATLDLTCIAQSASGIQTVSPYRMKRAWTEAGATWRTFDGTNAWQAFGADDANDRETATPLAPTASVGSCLTPITIAMNFTNAVQNWVDNVWPNNGFILINDNETTNNTMKAIASSETASGPKLTIVYTLPTCGDGIKNQPSEECDNTDLGGNSCATIPGGFTGGTLLCNASCQFDTSACTGGGSFCGDSTIDRSLGEECEPPNSQVSCVPYGYSGGGVTCNNSCLLDFLGNTCTLPTSPSLPPIVGASTLSLSEGGSSGSYEKGKTDVIPDAVGFCPQGMLWVPAPGRFCIDKYEQGQGQTRVASQSSCSSQDKSLPTSYEWWLASLGTPDDAISCNTNSAGLVPQGSLPGCRSKIGAYDMVGNLAEWTLDEADCDTTSCTFQGVSYIFSGYVRSITKEGVPNALILGSPQSSLAGDYVELPSAPGGYAVVRGGDYASGDLGARAGSHSLTLTFQETQSDPKVGWRCVVR